MSRIIVIAGVTESGKTTEAQRLLEEESPEGPAIFFDTPGDQEANFAGWSTAFEPGEFKARLRERRKRIYYRPNVPILTWNAKKADPQIVEHLQAISMICFGHGGCTLCVDEIHVFNQGDKMLPQIGHIVYHGRHTWNGQHVRLICTSQTPVQIPLRLRSQAQEFRIFTMSEKSDQDYFAARIGKSNAAQLATLGQFEFLLWQQNGEVCIAGGPR